jgi:hypothetical protein
VAKLTELVQQLKDEIASLKGQKPKPKILPSQLEKKDWRKRFKKYEGPGNPIASFSWGWNINDLHKPLIFQCSPIAQAISTLQVRSFDITRWMSCDRTVL